MQGLGWGGEVVFEKTFYRADIYIKCSTRSRDLVNIFCQFLDIWELDILQSLQAVHAELQMTAIDKINVTIGEAFLTPCCFPN